nr:MAG TPA: hypothetical protein [Caudoviricetes sp.]
MNGLPLILQGTIFFSKKFFYFSAKRQSHLH